MPTFKIKRNKYFEINQENINHKENTYCLLMSHSLNDLPEYSDENIKKYQQKILLSYHKLYLTPKKNLIFNIKGTLPQFLKKEFKLNSNDIESTTNIYDRNNIKIYVVLIKWNVHVKNPFNKIIQLFKFKDYFSTHDIYQSILKYSSKYLKQHYITNDNNSINSNFYNLYFKMIGLHDVSKYNLIKYINNNI